MAQWRDFPQELAAATGLPTFVYDRSGHGESAEAARPRSPRYLHEEAAALALLLEANHIHDPVLIGHSDGGSIALLYPFLSGRQPRGIITLAAHVFVEEETLRGIRAVEASDVRQRLRRYHGDKTDALFDAWAGIWLSPEFRPFDISRELHAVRCPVLAIQGAADEFGTPAQLAAIEANVRGEVSTLLIPGCGHEPHHQARNATLSAMKPALLQWLGQPSGPARSAAGPA